MRRPGSNALYEGKEFVPAAGCDFITMSRCDILNYIWSIDLETDATYWSYNVPHSREVKARFPRRGRRIMDTTSNPGNLCATLYLLNQTVRFDDDTLVCEEDTDTELSSDLQSDMLPWWPQETDYRAHRRHVRYRIYGRRDPRNGVVWGLVTEPAMEKQWHVRLNWSVMVEMDWLDDNLGDWWIPLLRVLRLYANDWEHPFVWRRSRGRAGPKELRERETASAEVEVEDKSESAMNGGLIVKESDEGHVGSDGNDPNNTIPGLEELDGGDKIDTSMPRRSRRIALATRPKVSQTEKGGH